MWSSATTELTALSRDPISSHLPNNPAPSGPLASASSALGRGELSPWERPVLTQPASRPSRPPSSPSPPPASGARWPGPVGRAYGQEELRVPFPRSHLLFSGIGASRCSFFGGSRVVSASAGAPGLALGAVGEPRASRQRWGCRGRKRRRRDYETRPAGSGAHSSPWTVETVSAPRRDVGGGLGRAREATAPAWPTRERG